MFIMGDLEAGRSGSGTAQNPRSAVATFKHGGWRVPRRARHRDGPWRDLQDVEVARAAPLAVRSAAKVRTAPRNMALAPALHAAV
jgi:hypothetical protein